VLLLRVLRVEAEALLYALDAAARVYAELATATATLYAPFAQVKDTLSRKQLHMLFLATNATYL